MQTLDAFFTAETAQKAGCVDRQGAGNPPVASLEYKVNFFKKNLTNV
jgi:hypothetical protein